MTDALTVTGIFVAAMVVISLVNGAISRRIKTSPLESLDRSLGFLFGLARGVLVVCLAYLIMVVFVPPEEQPQSVLEARALPLVEIGAVWLVEAVPSNRRGDWLEAIATAHEGVTKAFAIQAGRELRVVLDADRVKEEDGMSLARTVAQQIEDEMSYPGEIRVTLIREQRFIEYAR